jgi:phage shock protein PspC (stress-responsive transcriptional regulator)
MISRKMDRCIILGVCGGLSEETGLPIWWVRMTLVALQVYISSWVWVIYLIVGILLPSEELTWSEKFSQAEGDVLGDHQNQKGLGL